ncbi:uncharacterized protein DS421_12g357260 [Arachis hypogaea]|nr:uncharacterized protein DS421_12g357260 [Arachis hypogaea]
MEKMKLKEKDFAVNQMGRVIIIPEERLMDPLQHHQPQRLRDGRYLPEGRPPTQRRQEHHRLTCQALHPPQGHLPRLPQGLFHPSHPRAQPRAQRLRRRPILPHPHVGVQQTLRAPQEALESRRRRGSLSLSLCSLLSCR